LQERKGTFEEKLLTFQDKRRCRAWTGAGGRHFETYNSNQVDRTAGKTGNWEKQRLVPLTS